MHIKDENEIAIIEDEIKTKCQVIQAIVLKRQARMLQEKQKEIQQKIIPPIAGYGSGFITLTAQNLVNNTLSADSALWNLLYSFLTALGAWLAALSVKK
jgi:hypothetical protein